MDQPLDGMCNDAASYCGVRGQRYPDKRSMGFPFDRSGRQGVDSLRSFLTPNMFIMDATIRFMDRIEAPGGRNVTTFSGQGQQLQQQQQQPQQQQLQHEHKQQQHERDVTHGKHCALLTCNQI